MKIETENKPVDLKRRRLAKGGLAASVVLATLASKNALAAVPYQCTISGMISGNTSPNGPATDAPCALGSSGSWWSATLTNAENSPGARTLAALSPTSAYDTKPGNGNGNNPTIVKATPNGDPATIYEILNYEAGSPAPENLDYAKKALVLYLNAEALNGTGGHDFYPLNKMEAGGIFNAIVDGDGYSGTTSLGSFSWTNSDLKGYVDLLYH